MKNEELIPKLGKFYKINRRKMRLSKVFVKINCGVFNSGPRRIVEYVFENRKGRQMHLTSIRHIKEWE